MGLHLHGLHASHQGPRACLGGPRPTFLRLLGCSASWSPFSRLAASVLMLSISMPKLRGA